MNKNQIVAIVPAAGVGKRMQSKVPKQYIEIAGKTVLQHTVEKLAQIAKINKIIVAVSKDDPYISEIKPELPAKVVLTQGGAERADSVLAGLNCLDVNEYPWALVHDAARPCVRADDIRKLIDHVLQNQQGAILAAPVRDTIKLSNAAQKVEKTVDRSALWHALTPQMFATGLLQHALQKHLQDGCMITDEASAMELSGHPVHLIEGAMSNIKITRPEDLEIAEMFISRVL
ncbi:2-C-methyl-D-erythritol 4-phosphate cytidylyltransferase [Catenovulum sediminis]|uniref:2-C-methyl-D-erythritol 4-phosphate cytidylyltransferase n=1 Tax=Catenovulum sediminis TaxID=1740262 RepID=A0ABV1RGD0_9ALTE|nr:2-C-methyl-D-erythritol 4-phosphate cytidylyltransferase [Catenovulum sediminis]